MDSHLLVMELVRAAMVSVSLARIFQAHLYRDVRIFVSDPVSDNVQWSAAISQLPFPPQFSPNINPNDAQGGWFSPHIFQKTIHSKKIGREFVENDS